MGSARRLLSVRRAVPAARLPAYARGWERVRAAAAAAGVHAWLFRAATPPDTSTYLEFLEWSAAAADPTAGPELAVALGELAAAFGGAVERWDEVPPSYFPAEGQP